MIVNKEVSRLNDAMNSVLFILNTFLHFYLIFHYKRSLLFLVFIFWVSYALDIANVLGIRISLSWIFPTSISIVIYNCWLRWLLGQRWQTLSSRLKILVVTFIQRSISFLSPRLLSEPYRHALTIICTSSYFLRNLIRR